MADDDITGSEFMQMEAAEFVVGAIKDIGTEVNAFNFPNPIDGTKRVHRCVAMVLSGKLSVLKSASVIGDIQKSHPHGDATIYNTMCNMAAPYRYAFPIVQIKGKGPQYGNTPADMRYTDVTISPVFNAVYKDLHDNCIPMTYSKSGIPIPRYYIPVIPMALLNDYKTIGVGFSGNDIPRNFQNICDLAIAFIKHKETRPFDGFPIRDHAKKLMPEWQIPCTVLNAEELEEEYAKGNFACQIKVEGRVELHKNMITLNTIMPTADYNTQGYGALHDMIAGTDKKKLVEYIANACDSINSRDSRSKLFARLEIALRGNNNPFEVWREITKYIPFNGSVTPAPRYNDPVVEVDRIMEPLEILQYWYDARVRAVRTDIESKLAALNAEFSLLSALLIVVDHTDEVVSIIRNAVSIDDSVAKLRAQYELTISQAKSLTKLPLSTLTNSSREDLVAKREKCQNDILNLEADILRIPSIMVESIKKLKKRFGDTPTVTRYGNYIGYVKLYGRHIIQIESTNEISEILERFKKREADVVVYTAPPKTFMRILDGKVERYTKSAITEGDILTSPYPITHTYTVSIRPTGNVVVVKGMKPPLTDGTRTFYLPNKVIRVNKDRKLERIKLSEAYRERKQMDAIGLMSNAQWFLPDEDVVYVATMTDDKIGTLSLQRITRASTRFVFPTGNLLMYSYSLTGEDWYITLGEDCRDKVGIKTVYCIPKADTLFEGAGGYVEVNLLAHKSKSKIIAVV